MIVVRVSSLSLSALLASATLAVAQPGALPPGPAHDSVVKACTVCHDATMITGQHQTAAQWSATVKQMISNGAKVAPADFDKIVGYLAKNFGTGKATATAAPAAAAAPARSKNDPPVYTDLTWQRIEGKPVDTRWPEKQDDAPDFPGQTRAPYHATVPYKTIVITNKLTRPWALQFLPDGKMLVNQRMGQMALVDQAGTVTNVTGVPEVAWQGGQGGLLDLALAPDYAATHRIFFSFNEPAGPQNDKDVGRDGAQSRIAVGRAVFDEGGATLKDVTVIFRSKPAISVNLYPTKQGSRIVFDKQGNLLVTIGDRDSTRLQPPAWNVSQELSTHLGKIVRITQDGAAPPDNPFVGVEDALPEIWVTGVRSQEGLTYDKDGKLWEVEDGPRGGDELNVIEKGKNYGWPVVTHGIDYPGWVVNMGATHHSGMVDPRYYWDPTIAPSGLTFYYADLFPAWKGDLFVGGLRGEILDRLKLSADNKVVEEEPLLAELHSRIRDVRVGPDGALYVLTDVDSLIKITPK